jgi:hypothetical protein
MGYSTSYKLEKTGFLIEELDSRIQIKRTDIAVVIG